MLNRIIRCLSLVALAASAWAAAAPVQLQWAYMGAGATDPHYTYSILVSDLGSPKSVGIWYKDLAGNLPWQFKAASFVKLLPNHQELWQLTWSDREQLSDQFSFAVKYSVAGQTYWDNNAGKNYRVAGPLGVIVGASTKVALPSFASGIAAGYNANGELSATIYAADLDPNKTVGIVYSTDGWKTKRTAYANFYSNGFYPDRRGVNPGEIWSLNLRMPNDQTLPVEFAVWHTSNGVTYWDNNLGQNYKVSLPQ